MNRWTSLILTTLAFGAACLVSGWAENHAPQKPPDWIPGYRIRYTLRVISNVSEQAPQTVIASVPTGGWLMPDARDLAVQTASGKKLPLAVLSHDPAGETIVQFRRDGNETWYWLYAVNPNAPEKDPALVKMIEDAKRASEEAVLKKMAAQKLAAERAGVLRDLIDRADRERATAGKAAGELAEWDKLLPERVAAANASAAKIPPAQEEVRKTTEAHLPLGKAADEKSATAKTLANEAQEARKAAELAGKAIETAMEVAASAEAAAKKAVQDADAAREAATKATAGLDAAREAAEKLRKAASVGTAADTGAAKTNFASAVETEAKRQIETAKLSVKNKTEAARRAQDDAEQKRRAVKNAEEKKIEADRTATEKQVSAEAAEKVAQAARLAAAPSATAKAKAESDLAGSIAASNQAAGLVADANKRIAEAKELKDTAEKKLAELTPQLDPAREAANAAAQATELAVADAKAKNDAYFELAAGADPSLFKEGLTVEFREWAGDALDDWPSVAEGLGRSDNVIANAVVAEAMHNEKPFRRGIRRNFAASFRGYLKITEPGIYSFCVNADDAAFLFINGYKVYSRTGTNKPITGRMPVYAVGADIQLEAGSHPFEIHNVVGNTPDATGYCSLILLQPGSKNWQVAPQTAFTRALTAAPTEVAAADGAQTAVFEFGVDDALRSDGTTLYLVRIEAQGGITEPAKLKWSFGDGSEAVGQSATHVFFTEGDFDVSLKSNPGLPPFRRRCHVHAPPIATSPHSLDKALRSLESGGIEGLKQSHLNDIFHFLLVCEQPSRWPLMEKLCRRLLGQQGPDMKYRALLYASLMEAVAQQGRGADVTGIKETALREVGQVGTLRALIVLREANVNRDLQRDFAAADKLYAQVIQENRRLRHPIVRRAAVEWGDMFMEAGDLARAAEAYSLSRSLGPIGIVGAGQDDPSARGALLRVAEQQLRGGDIRQTERMLDRIESEFPEQKTEGIYRFLRGEADRHAGRYEEAIRNYEVLTSLQQWPAYRPAAMFGIADSCRRMGDLNGALDWLSKLERSFPDFFAERRLHDYRNNMESRRASAGEDAGIVTNSAPDSNSAPSVSKEDAGIVTNSAPSVSKEEAGIVTNSAPDSNSAPSAIQDDFEDEKWRSGFSLGFAGSGSFFVKAPKGGEMELASRQLRNIPGQGALWIEFWYRERLGGAGTGGHRVLTARVFSGAGEKTAEKSLYPERTFGEWHKAGFLMPLPPSADGTVKVSAADTCESFEIDALKILHVSDRQNSELRNFIEGADPQ